MDAVVIDRTSAPAATWRLTVALAVLVLAALIDLGLSQVWPRHVPRLAIWPKPPTQHWTADCGNQSTNIWVRERLIWQEGVFTTMGAC